MVVFLLGAGAGFESTDSYAHAKPAMITALSANLPFELEMDLVLNLKFIGLQFCN